MTNPLTEGQQSRLAEPCSLVIFGATGDLTSRKIVPALYNLLKDGQLPSLFTCIGFARRPKTNEEFRAEMKDAVGKYSRTKPIEDSIWNHFQDHLFYHQAEFHEDEGYEKLKTLLQQFDTKYGTKGNRIFYLATQPVSFPVICEKLHKAGLIYDEKTVKDKWSRIIIEKPFGHDLASAHALQDELLHYCTEKQIYRIDHYLGKETVQNLLVFRFANSIFESLWNNQHIDHIQITVAEDIGIGTRGKFYENAGQLRDMIQNHTMQILSLVAMEPPVSLEADAIR
ncbi:MAG TPA: glucose-6-phosphate dehydrogenase, partial [Rhabdochlamydiaceae bacterium]